jgi:uncharacterized Rmd1/YagE family protein
MAPSGSRRRITSEIRQPAARMNARALALGDRLEIKPDLGRSRIVRGRDENAEGVLTVLFRFGAAVLFDVDEAAFEARARQLAPRVVDPYDEPEVEEIEIVVDPQRREGIDHDVIVLHEASVERLQIVAEILGKSVALAQEEQAVSAVFEQIEPLAVDLQRRGRVGRGGRALLQHIGNALLVQHRTVARAEIAEKPELLWERPDLERLYLRLEEEYELRERNIALERKLRLISDTAETLLELLQTRRSLRVEWYIVLLIVVEIVLTLYELFFRHQA